MPVQRPRPLRRLRLAARPDPAEQRRLKAAVVREQFAQPRRARGRPRDRRGVAGRAAALAVARPVRRRPVGRAGPAPSPLARRRRPSTTARSRVEPARCGPSLAAALARAPARSTCRSTPPVRSTTTRLDRRGHPTSQPRRPRPGGELPEEPSAPRRAACRRAATGRSRAPASGRCTRRPPTRSSAAVAGFAERAPGETVLDLYAGVGLFGGALAPAAGADGPGGLRGVRRGAPAPPPTRNLADLPQAEVWQGEVDAEGLAELLAELGGAPDVVVLDPPRAGRRAGGQPAAGRDRRPGGRLRRLRPGRAGPRRRAPSPRPGYRLAADPRVRRLPDDRPRRVRGPARPGLTGAVRYGLGVPTWEYASVITANDAESQRAGVSVKLPGGQSERQQGDTSSVLNRLGARGLGAGELPLQRRRHLGLRAVLAQAAVRRTDGRTGRAD